MYVVNDFPGSNENGFLLDQYCGNNTIHPPIITPVPYLYLRFHTDSSIVDHGFHLSYNFTRKYDIMVNVQIISVRSAQ